jgi:hypothetical protein
MSALRICHKNRSCFHGRRELRVVIRLDTGEFESSMRRIFVSTEKTVRPARARQRFADTMAGNGHLWAKR